MNSNMKKLSADDKRVLIDEAQKRIERLTKLKAELWCDAARLSIEGDWQDDFADRVATKKEYYRNAIRKLKGRNNGK